MKESIENQMYSVGFGRDKDEVLEKDFYKFISGKKLSIYNNCMHKYYFKNEVLIAYYIHGLSKNNYYIVDNKLPGINPQQFEVILPVKYIAGCDPYKENSEISVGLWKQLDKDKYIIEYKGRENKITKRDIVLTVIHMFKEYVMPYTKTKVTTEEDLDAEVEHFYFLNRFNLLQLCGKQ